MPKTVIYYFTSYSGNNPVREFINTLQLRQQAKVRRILQLINEYGLSSVIPHIKKLSGLPLWEIRILGNDNLRILYAIKAFNSIVILHGFIKKSQKTPVKEIGLALQRWQEWQDRYCK